MKELVKTLTDAENLPVQVQKFFKVVKASIDKLSNYPPFSKVHLFHILSYFITTSHLLQVMMHHE